MPKSKADTIEVLPLAPVFHGSREHPQVAEPNRPVHLPRELAEELIAAGKAVPVAA